VIFGRNWGFGFGDCFSVGCGLKIRNGSWRGYIILERLLVSIRCFGLDRLTVDRLTGCRTRMSITKFDLNNHYAHCQSC